MHKTMCVLPAVPDQVSGGGKLLYEVLAFLRSRGRVAAIVPIAASGVEILEQCSRDPVLREIEWYGFPEYRAPGFSGLMQRLFASTPSNATKMATARNQFDLDAIRLAFQPDIELAVSSWVLGLYRGLRFPKNVRLYMVNVDPDIVCYYGPSLKRRLACLVDRPKVERLCRRAVAAAGRVGAISATDIPALNRLSGRQDVGYVPPLMRPQPVDRTGAIPNTVLITTNFTYSQNVKSLEWFFRECWPHVSDQAHLTITGKDEDDRLATLCRANPRTTYVGCVSPTELDDAFGRTAVAVNPTQLGSGFQIKLLDAIARGVPIVSTAFSNKIGSSIASSDDPKTLAELINARLTPGSVPPFDYAAFHRDAIAAWDRFLFAE